jgi:Spy/CpxP family protein refolding chaperone
MEGMGGMGGGGGRNRGGGMDGMGSEMGGMRTQRQSRTDQIADKLKLNKEQKEQMLAIFSAAREKATPISTQLFKQRADIATAMINGKTGDEVQKMLADYSATAAQLTGLEAEAFGKIYATLKPNQQKNAGQAFELIAGVFTMTGRGGQGRGRGGSR